MNNVHEEIVGRLGRMITGKVVRGGAEDKNKNKVLCKTMFEVVVHELLQILHSPLALGSLRHVNHHPRFICQPLTCTAHRPYAITSSRSVQYSAAMAFEVCGSYLP